MENTENNTTKVASNSVEAKIQNQFNEEKWTRITSKDVSISRFKILENILDEVKSASKISSLKQLSKEQIEEYDASVAARYFLGMIALQDDNPEDLIFLKQLLDQFLESSKWAVVEYLSDKMLSVSENRTILRAKANALEKLGKNKELIPVLEKLAKLDKKNPDISLKYADAILNDDLEKAIQFYKQTAESYAKNQQFDKLKSVWNKLVDLIPEDANFFKKIERILSGLRQKEPLADLFVQLAYTFIKNEDVDNIIATSKKILELNPNYTRFKNELIRSYKTKYKDHSLLEDFIKYSGLLDSRRSISNAILNFETNIVFDKDNYVFHRNWGVGQIKELDTEKMIINFKDKPDHKMEITMALKSLKPLQKDHFWVHQFEEPDRIQNLFENEQVEFFKILIKSFGNSITLSDIKAEIANIYIPLKSWSKWWSKTRALILKDSMIRVSSQRKDIIELTDIAIQESEVSIEKFQNCVTIDEKVKVALDALKDTEGNKEALEYFFPLFLESLRSFDRAVRFQALFILDLLQDVLQDDDFSFTEGKEKIIKELKGLTIDECSALNEVLKHTEMKRAYSKYVKENHEEWQKIYIEFLLQTPIKIHKQLILDLIQENANNAILEFYNRVRKESKEKAEIYIWSLKNVLAGNWSVSDLPLGEQILSLFRLMRNIPKIEKKGTKLKNAARDIIFGGTEESLFISIEKDAKDLVRKLASLSKDVPFFSDIEKEKIYTKLVSLNESVFADDQAEANVEEDYLVYLDKNNLTVASDNAIEAMKAELTFTLHEEIPKNSEEIGVAQEKGDLRENSEYKAAMEKQVILQAQVTRLEKQIKEAIILTSDKVKTSAVTLGCKIKLTEVSSNDIFIYSIMDVWDADVDKGIISFKSPLGESLLDHKVGEVIEFGDGENKQELKILSIEKAVNNEGVLI